MKFMNIILLQCNLSELNPELTEIVSKTSNVVQRYEIFANNFKQHN
jgi:hypothetical protein